MNKSAKHIQKRSLNRLSFRLEVVIGIVTVCFFYFQCQLLPSGLGDQGFFHNFTTSTEHEFDKNTFTLIVEIAKSYTKELNCSLPLVPVYDRIIDPSSSSSQMQERKIPNTLHVSFKNRCVPPDIADSVDKWKKALPNHSIIFHDDEAVDRLIFDQSWPEFPHLKLFMNCVKFTSAMRIDIWRILVLYRYGGIYTDIDNWPMKNFREDLIQVNDTGFFFTDGRKRPSQWFLAFEPKHPMMYFSMLEILKNLASLKDLSRPQVVFVTGPDAVNEAFKIFMSKKENGDDTTTLIGTADKLVRRIGRDETDDCILGGLGGTQDEKVTYDGKEMTKKNRVEQQSGVLSWQNAIFSRDNAIIKTHCYNHLYMQQVEKDS